jgi:hypothetical protein
VRFAINSLFKPIGGRVVYREHEHSFDFEAAPGQNLELMYGSKGTASIAIGTLQIEVAIETGACLYVWGLHPKEKWNIGTLPIIQAKRSCISLLPDVDMHPGISENLADVGEWFTTHDLRSGWLCISQEPIRHSEHCFEFCDDTVAGLDDDKLVSLWLRPDFD